jgi:23S rRNA (uridine2552-2'-O)-methyltransferase
LPKDWVRRRKKDYYYRKAKKEEYRSRASFKLLQAVQKHGFIEPGDVVVDLGSAPGGWLQIAREIVGEEGFVLGVDIVEVEPLGYPNVYAIVGDVKDSKIAMRIRALLPRLADAVTSDVSPSISGIWEVDHARQIELAEGSLGIATSVLKVNGSFFVKVFQGDMFRKFLDEVGRSFSVVKVIKPKASRKRSAEIYVLGLNFKGQR